MGQTPEQYKAFRDAVSNSMVPMKRDGSPEEMAKTILFLATDATYMTGANIVADGGVVNFSPTLKLQ
jgi:NAD(P)-dependent dehydrogenase (short-subunit alcohol dehydrogenase family)